MNIYYDSENEKLTHERRNGYYENQEVDLLLLLNQIIKKTGIKLDQFDLSR